MAQQVGWPRLHHLHAYPTTRPSPQIELDNGSLAEQVTTYAYQQLGFDSFSRNIAATTMAVSDNLKQLLVNSGGADSIFAAKQCRQRGAADLSKTNQINGTWKASGAWNTYEKSATLPAAAQAARGLKGYLLAKAPDLHANILSTFSVIENDVWSTTQHMPTNWNAGALMLSYALPGSTASDMKEDLAAQVRPPVPALPCTLLAHSAN